MIRALLLAALVLPLAAAGCATAQPTAADAQTPALDEPFRLAVGETARLGDHSVRFVAVAEDSRCPEGVQCVWAGVATVRVEVDGEAVDLTVPPAPMRDGETATVRVGDHTLEVTGLTPYPGSAAAEAGDPVEAVFVVTAG
jgi:hypothetical protein